MRLGFEIQEVFNGKVMFKFKNQYAVVHTHSFFNNRLIAKLVTRGYFDQPSCLEEIHHYYYPKFSEHRYIKRQYLRLKERD